MSLHSPEVTATEEPGPQRTTSGDPVPSVAQLPSIFEEVSDSEECFEASVDTFSMKEVPASPGKTPASGRKHRRMSYAEMLKQEQERVPTSLTWEEVEQEELELKQLDPIKRTQRILIRWTVSILLYPQIQ